LMYYYMVNGIKVFFEPELDGGGSSFGQMYVPILKRLGIRGKNCYEAFSGPAFIGFSLLGAGICDNLYVSDINPKAIDYVKLTVRYNKLEEKVKYSVSDLLENVPKDVKFDLVVGNPPHFKDKSFTKNGSSNMDILKTLDQSWELHKKFYNNIRDYMKPGGNIILVENSEGSDPKDFIPMIMQSNLKLKGIIYPNYDDILYTYKLLISNNYNFYDSKIIGCLASIVLKMPDVLFKAIAFTYRYKLLKSYKKFYFIWSQVI